jgi:hypothetical protein
MIKENWKEGILAFLVVAVVIFVGFLVINNIQTPIIYAQGYCADKEGIQHINFPEKMTKQYEIVEINCSNKENPVTWNITSVSW